MKKLLVYVFLLVCLAGCNKDVKDVVYLDGVSMSPTIEHGDKVIVDKDYYRDNDIKRDDLVLFYMEDNEHIKRVIGLPNELVQINEGTIYIDNKPLVSEYDFVDVWEGGMPAEGVQLKSDEYFLIGDNLKPLTSKDSRMIGPIAKENIIGKVVEK